MSPRPRKPRTTALPFGGPQARQQGSHHSMFELKEGVRGWFRVRNDGVVISIWVEQPDGSRRLFLPAKGPIE